MTNSSKQLMALIAVSCFGIAARAAEPAVTPSPEQVQFFEKKIRPVLASTCYNCHSSEANKVKAGLYVDTREGLLAGGDGGPALVPGKPDKSLLIKAIRANDPDTAMPPKGDHLTPAQVADFEKWVAMGAPDPREKVTGPVGMVIDPEKVKAHWAFKPISNPTPPEVKDPAKWVKTPIDSFILAKLQNKGLQPSPKADKRALIRRATYDLTGLPPTPEEVDAFVADDSSEAFAKVVDRLLASPRYGERWGRHWLDIARYADTSGDRAGGKRPDGRFPYAWTYRDYVIDAFNRDLPYDQFIIQQIAADKLSSSEDRKNLAAMGFLTVGKRFMGNANDVIDDRIDVISEGLMGLTVSCARCHDHKFDPIPTKDYYSLHGVFASSAEPTEGPVIMEPKSKEAYNDYLKQVASIEEEANAFRDKETEKLSSSLREKAADYLLLANEVHKANGKLNRNKAARAKNLDLGGLQLWEDSLRRWAKNNDRVMAPWFALAALEETNFATDSKKVLDDLAASEKHVNRAVVDSLIKVSPASLKEVAQVYGQLFNDVSKASTTEKGKEPTPLADSNLEGIRQLVCSETSPMQANGRVLDRVLGNQFSTKETAIRNQIITLNMSHPGTPVRAMVLEDSKVRNSPVLVRGEPANRGPIVPRQFLEILSGGKREPFKNGSGRLELAEAIVSRSNPLTARVIVNRIWQRHFGEAIVRTPSDFGLRSDAPTHPELLDYLATSFMDNGWSIKKLHRQIMLSSVYQQDSRSNDQGIAADPANQLVWRMNVRRLDFEEIRDTLLVVGGSLDLTMGGPSIALTDIGESKVRYAAKRMAASASNQGPVSPRRTVYSTVDREGMPEIFRIFDFANPDMSTGQRYLTTVPQQALFMMNSPFVADQARHLVGRSDFQALNQDSQKVDQIYRILLQRQPTATELDEAIGFVKSPGPATELVFPISDTPTDAKAAARAKALAKKNPSKPLNRWEQLAQVILLSNETVFLN